MKTDKCPRCGNTEVGCVNGDWKCLCCGHPFTVSADILGFEALDKNGHPIVTVVAYTEQEADMKLEEDLNRVGRRDWYENWVSGGRKINCLG